MKKSLTIVFIIISAAFTSSFTHYTQADNEKQARDVITKLTNAISKMETMKWNLKVIERIKGVEKRYGSSVKLKLNPRKLYINIKGTEVLWVAGQNDGKALVHPNSFPYINLNLDPLGSLMRQEQHHTIHEMGFNYMGEIIKNFVLKAGDKFGDCFKYEGEEEHNYQKCHKITLNNPGFTYVNYTVKKGETMITIARKLFVGEYMILENNPQHKNYDSVKEGDIIKVPTAYAKHVTLYIDKLYNVPIGIKVEDDKGLYEQYDYFFLQVNPRLEDAEFTKEYKDYKF
jgi:outer membrane lipoprotein-sorting protein